MKHRRADSFVRFALALWAVPSGARAEQYGDFLYASNGLTATITDYVGAGGDVAIPSMIDTLVVTAVGDYASSNQVSVTGVTIPGSVASIGESAFLGCGGLTSIVVDASNPFYSGVFLGVRSADHFNPKVVDPRRGDDNRLYPTQDAIVDEPSNALFASDLLETQALVFLSHWDGNGDALINCLFADGSVRGRKAAPGSRLRAYVDAFRFYDALRYLELPD